MNKLISVIIPVYNAKSTLIKCVESVSKQTNVFLEVILVDDGSTDGSDKICKDLASKYSCIRFFKQANAGPGIARKTGVSQATGEYITFVDSDDYVDIDLFKNIIALFNENPTLDIVEFGYRCVAVNEEILSEHPMKEFMTQNTGCLEHYIKQNNVTNYLWNKIFRRELFNGIDFPAFFMSEDQCVLVQLYAKAKLIMTLPKIYYNYVLTTNSLCRKPFNYKHFDVLDAAIWINNFLSRIAPNLCHHQENRISGIIALLYARTYFSSMPDKKDKMFRLRNEFKHYYKICSYSKIICNSISLKHHFKMQLFKYSPNLFCITIRLYNSLFK